MSTDSAPADKEQPFGGVGQGGARRVSLSAPGRGCGNFVSPRTLSINGTTTTCNGGNCASIPAARNGGYCVQTTSGNQPWAYFSDW